MSKITELRKAGKFEEALQQAEESLSQEPESKQIKNEKVWVHYDLMKLAVEQSDPRAFEQHFDAILLMHPEDDGFIGNRLGWLINKMCRHLRQQHNADHDRIVALLEKSRQLTFDKEDPYSPYSAILKCALQVRDSYPNLLEFLDWWNLDNLSGEDFRPFATRDGKSIMALAEQAYITYARQLRLLSEKSPEEAIPIIKEFLPKLNQLMEDHPEYTYPAYYKAQLLIVLGHYDEVLEELIPFVRQKPEEFWVWSNLADVFANKEEYIKAISCYSKALSGKTKPSFLVKVKEKLAKVFLEQGRMAEAKTEYEEAMRIRQREWGSLPPHLLALTEESWYQQTEARQGNRDLYRQYAPMAEAIVYEDMEEDVGVILHVDPRKHQAWLRVNRSISAKVYFNQLREKISPGDFVAVRLEKREGKDSHWYKVMTIRKTDQEPDPDIIRHFEGSLYLREGNPFGFVDEEIFVPQHLVVKHNLDNGKHISGLAAINYDTKGDKWSWKALTINDIQEPDETPGDGDDEPNFNF